MNENLYFWAGFDTKWELCLVAMTEEEAKDVFLKCKEYKKVFKLSGD